MIVLQARLADQTRAPRLALYARVRWDGHGEVETEGVVSRRDGGGGWL